MSTLDKIFKILSFPFTFLIKLYQKYISPHMKPSCRFTPSCSSYAVKALEEWGPLIGLPPALWRVLRCNPFSKGGYDPVPLRKRRKKKDPDGGTGENGKTPCEDGAAAPLRETQKIKGQK